jgi:hypothetical protein
MDRAASRPSSSSRVDDEIDFDFDFDFFSSAAAREGGITKPREDDGDDDGDA